MRKQRRSVKRKTDLFFFPERGIAKKVERVKKYKEIAIRKISQKKKYKGDKCNKMEKKK